MFTQSRVPWSVLSHRDKAMSMHVHCNIHFNIHMNEELLRQGKAKQLHLKTTPFFSREKEELTQAGLKPAMFCIPGRRSTNRGSPAGQAKSLNVMQRQSCLFPDKQGNSISVHVHVNSVKATQGDYSSFFQRKK